MERKKSESYNNKITSRLQKMVKERKVPNIVLEKGTLKQKRLDNKFQEEEY